MHIGIDITSIIYDRGVSRYTANLVRALAARPDVELSLYGCTWRQQAVLRRFHDELMDQFPKQRLCKTVIQPYPPKVQKMLWNTFNRNPVKPQLPGIQVFHSWDWIQPPDQNLPIVSTIHDLAILRYPETAHPEVVAMHRKAWQRLKAVNAELIAVSYATKKDIIELLEYPADKIHVVHEALPLETTKVSATLDENKSDQIKRRMHLDRPYLLFVGTREPRKNLKRLIQAWEPLAGDLDLVVAGEAGWDESEKLLRKSNAKKHLRLLGKVSNEELAVLYGEAEAFMYPSLYEGFGLPILEAFHYGTPVLTSKASSMPEVAGNAAELIDPSEVESIRGGIQKILKETKEEQQYRLQKMIVRLHHFSWQSVGEGTMRVYQSAVSL